MPLNSNLTVRFFKNIYLMFFVAFIIHTQTLIPKYTCKCLKHNEMEVTKVLIKLQEEILYIVDNE